MHPRTICIITALAFAGVAFAEPSWVSFGKGTEGQTPQLEVLESSAAGTAINLETYGMWVEDVKENEETFQRITLAGSSFTCEVGKPMLPVVRKLVAIPATAGVSVKVEVNSTTTFKDYLVYPTQEPQMGPEPKPEFQKDKEFYTLDTLYPVELSEAGAPAIMNDVRLVELAIQPFRYNPAKKELTVATDLTVRLDYSGFDERNVLTRKTPGMLPQWLSIYREAVLNFSDLYEPAKMFSGEPAFWPGYLIIYAHDFRPEVCPKLQDFIDWKIEKGIPVYTKDLNDLGIQGNENDTSLVKNYIKWWWDHLDPTAPNCLPCYVLLVGDARDYIPNPNPPPPWLGTEVQKGDNAHVPAFYIPMSDEYLRGVLVSDYHYQLLEGNDMYPEITVGRWCVRNQSELNAYVDKVFYYETDLVDQDWECDQSLLVAHRLTIPGGYPGIEEEDFRHMKEYIDTAIIKKRALPWPLTQYGDQGGTEAGVINAITTAGGVGIINYAGHGGIDCWSDWNEEAEPENRNFDTLNIENLNQSSFHGYPVVYNVACLNGAFTNPDTESVVEAWTRDPNGGAVATLGASRMTDIRANGRLDTTIFRSLYFTPPLYLHPLNCAMAVNYAKIVLKNQPYYNPDLHLRAYNWIGDPELDIWRYRPAQAYLLLAVNPFTVYVRRQSDNAPVAGSQVCVLREEGGYYYVATTDHLGAATFPDLTSLGTYRVTATNQVGPNICIIPISTVVLPDTLGGQQSVIPDIVEWNLKPVSPNPFRSSVTISYSIAGVVGSQKTRYVELCIFDVSGRIVKTLVSSEKMPGHYDVTWDGTDDSAANLPPAVYLVRMDADGFNSSEQVVLIK